MEDGEDLRLTLSLKTSELSPSCAATTVGSDRSPQESTRERSDEEDGGGRKKLRLSKLQASTLEDAFKTNHTLNPKEKLALARDLKLTPRQVEVWFQNRRARKKLKKTEVDCEMLKRCCENLSEENRRLQKELMELRALKRLPHGLCMQMGKAGGIAVPPPPTTLLSICPSCERATAAGVTAEQNGSYRGSTPLPLHRRRQISSLY